MHYPHSSHLRLLELLKDHRWHPIYRMVRVAKTFRISSCVYRLRKMGFEIDWRLEKRGTSYRLVA